MKKRLLLLIMSLSLAAGAAGCGSQSEGNNNTNKNEAVNNSVVEASVTAAEEKNAIIVTDAELEEVRNDYPFLENYLVKEMAEMRKSGKLKSTPYLNALERGDADASAPRLTYDDVVEIVKKYNCTPNPGVGLTYDEYVSSGQQEIDGAACSAAVAEITQIQAYPDMLFDIESMEYAPAIEGAVKYYLTDDEDHIVIVTGRNIEVLTFTKPYKIRLAVVLDRDHIYKSLEYVDGVNHDLTMFKPYTGIEYRVLRQKTEKALKEHGVEVTTGIKNYASADVGEEEMKMKNPTLSDELIARIVDMRKNGEEVITPYLNAVNAGENVGRLSYSDFTQIVENSGYQGLIGYSSKVYQELREEEDIIACEKIINEINAVQKYPDAVIDFEQITPSLLGNIPNAVLVYLTDDPGHIIFISGYGIHDLSDGKLTTVASVQTKADYISKTAPYYADLYSEIREETNKLTTA